MSKISFDPSTNVLTIPEVEGVVYKVDGVAVTGEIEVNRELEVVASPLRGYRFPEGTQTIFAYGPGTSEEVSPSDEDQDTSASEPIDATYPVEGTTDPQ